MNLSDLDWYSQALEEAANTAVSGAGVFMQPTADTVPDDLASFFSNAVPPAPGQPGYVGPDGWGGSGPGGFGPGDYQGGYTGEGDAVYWGSLGGDDEATAIAKAQKQAARQAARKAAREGRKTAIQLAKEVKKAASGGKSGSSGSGTAFNPMGHFGPGGHVVNAAQAAADAIKRLGHRQEERPSDYR